MRVERGLGAAAPGHELRRDDRLHRLPGRDHARVSDCPRAVWRTVRLAGLRTSRPTFPNLVLLTVALGSAASSRFQNASIRLSGSDFGGLVVSTALAQEPRVCRASA